MSDIDAEEDNDGNNEEDGEIFDDFMIDFEQFDVSDDDSDDGNTNLEFSDSTDFNLIFRLLNDRAQIAKEVALLQNETALILQSDSLDGLNHNYVKNIVNRLQRVRDHLYFVGGLLPPDFHQLSSAENAIIQMIQDNINNTVEFGINEYPPSIELYEKYGIHAFQIEKVVAILSGNIKLLETIMYLQKSLSMKISSRLCSLQNSALMIAH